MPQIHQLNATTNVVNADLLVVETDVATVPATKKITLSNLLSSLLGLSTGIDGWTNAQETWTYASATTFTCPGNQTAIYTAGVKLKLTNNTVKFFYVVSSSYNAGTGLTTVTVTGGSDYALAAGAISTNYYSRVSSPTGFPHWFNYVPSLTGGNADLSGYDTANFSIVGKVVYLNFSAVNKTLSGTAGQINISLPVPGIAKTYPLLAAAYDAGLTWRFVFNSLTTSSLAIHKLAGFSDWVGNETSVYIEVSGSYQMV